MMISSLLSLLFLVLLWVLIFFSFVGEDEEVVASDIDDGSNEEFSLHDMLLPPLIVWLQSASSPTGVSSSPSVLSSSSLPLPN